MQHIEGMADKEAISARSYGAMRLFLISGRMAEFGLLGASTKNAVPII